MRRHTLAAPPEELKDVSQGKERSRLRLLAPLRYLAIYHPEKTKYDFWYPLIIAVLAWFAFVFLFHDITVFGDSGLLKFTRDFLIMAIPFLFGSLASVAMGSPGIKIDNRAVGSEIYLNGEVLSLRRFVCYLLGYLCFVGLCLLFGVASAELVAPVVIKWVSVHASALEFIKMTGMLLYFINLSALVVTTLWALYFLTDVINRP